MPKKLLWVLLIASVALNVAGIGGFLYQRQFVAPRAGLEDAARELALAPAESKALLDMRRAVRADIRDVIRTNLAAARDVGRMVSDRPAGDPALKQAVARLAAERARLQEQAIDRIIAFRDTLSPAARARFVDLAGRPGFFVALLGLRRTLPDGEKM